MYHRGRQPYRGPSRPPRSQSGCAGIGRGVTPSTQPPIESAGSTTDQVLRLRLQSQVFLSRALELEKFMAQEELNDLRERVRRDNQPNEEHPVVVPPYPENTGRSRSLAERIDSAPRQTPSYVIVDDHGRRVTIREDPSLPPTVVVHPVDIHPRFLPLGSHFQEGGTGGPMFSRPQDWPEAIHENPATRPRGIRRWGSQPVNLDDLHVYLRLGDRKSVV